MRTRSIGKWRVDMTIAELGRISGSLVEHLAGIGPAGWDDEIRCCPDLIRVEWGAGLNAVARFPLGQVSRTSLPNVKAEYLFFSPKPWERGKFSTARGIGEGSSKEEVIRAYGKPTAQTVAYRYKGLRRLIYDEIGLAVSYGGFGVYELIVFRPGRGRSIWKF